MRIQAAGRGMLDRKKVQEIKRASELGGTPPLRTPPPRSPATVQEDAGILGAHDTAHVVRRPTPALIPTIVFGVTGI